MERREILCNDYEYYQYLHLSLHKNIILLIHNCRCKMNKLVVVLGLWIFAASSFAQDRADIEVSYTASVPNLKTGRVKGNQYVLVANATESKFYSPMTEYIDSLESTPEGEAIYKDIMRGAFASGKLDKAPRRDGSYYVLKSTADNFIKTYDVNGLDKYVMEESMPDYDWQLADSTRNILGYECQMATTVFNGREWTVWFTPEIPVTNGPWKLGGLPGLILEAAEPTGLYNFVATGLRQTSREIKPVYSSESYTKIDRKEYLKIKRKMVDNTVSQMNAQLSGLGISISAASNSAKNKSRKEIDFIETDY